jgi:hypothetical protein
MKPAAVIFRTTVMGHQGCTDMFSPLDGTKLVQNKRMSSKYYNWASFSESNAAMIKAFEDVWPSERFRVLDVSMFEQRGDGHNGHLPEGGTDCLHYCVPGPQLVWNQLLLHVLSSLTV